MAGRSGSLRRDGVKNIGVKNIDRACVVKVVEPDEAEPHRPIEDSVPATALRKLVMRTDGVVPAEKTAVPAARLRRSGLGGEWLGGEWVVSGW